VKEKNILDAEDLETFRKSEIIGSDFDGLTLEELRSIPLPLGPAEDLHSAIQALIKSKWATYLKK
jgi:hypothetical protein